MPNIEIHGFKDESHCPKTIELIYETLQELGLADDAIITVSYSWVKNCGGSNRPAQYIRVLSSKPKEIVQIIEALKRKNLGLDTEKPFRLLKFFDAREMESETSSAERARLTEKLLDRNPIPIDIPREVRKANLDKLPLAILRERVG